MAKADTNCQLELYVKEGWNEFTSLLAGRYGALSRGSDSSQEGLRRVLARCSGPNYKAFSQICAPARLESLEPFNANGLKEKRYGEENK